MNAHSFETFQILRKIDGFEDIAIWAAYHHEEPGGSGYPFHVPEAGLSLEARILRVADILQAVAQDRPYRAGMSEDEIRGLLQELTAQNKLDAAVVAVVLSNMGACLDAALLK
jgi:HD-GYP domain-containing protein (c-di-GMP phosphodiesterase class II)